MADKSMKQPETTRATVRACCDVSEQQGEIQLRLEMPGVQKEGLKISIEGDQLEIRGERKIARFNNADFLVREIREADYHQLFTLDNTIDRGKVDAAMKNGILTVTLHKKESEKPRRIQIISK